MPYNFPMLRGAFGPPQDPMLDSRTIAPARPPLGFLAGTPTPGPRDAFNRYAATMRANTEDPRQRSIASNIGSTLLPALVAGLVGAKPRDALVYGIGSAAFNYQASLDNFNSIEAKIAEAEAQLPGAEAEMNKNIAQGDYYESEALKNVMGSPDSAKKLHGTVQGANGNVWNFYNDGSFEDTKVKFNETGAAPTWQLVETVDANQKRYWTAVNTKDPSQTMILGNKPPPASLVQSSDKSADELARLEGDMKPEQNATLDATIDRAIENSTGWTTGLVGAAMNALPVGSQARSLKGDLDTIRSNLAFDRLQQMREQSKTGGALGNVSDRELALLQSTVAALDQVQDKDELKFRLNIVKNQYKIAMNAYNRAVEERRKLLEQRIQRAQPGMPPVGTPAQPPGSLMQAPQADVTTNAQGTFVRPGAILTGPEAAQVQGLPPVGARANAFLQAAGAQ